MKIHLRRRPLVVEKKSRLRIADGTVTANGQATTWYFEYGTSTSYGSKTAEKNAGAGTSTASVSGPVSTGQASGGMGRLGAWSNSPSRCSDSFTRSSSP